MGLIDITQTYEPGMKKYGSIDDFSYEWLRHYDTGFGMALSRFTMTSHLGTHIDSQYHFLKDGKKTIDIPLETLCGKAQVICLEGKAQIKQEDLEEKRIQAERILFKTDNTAYLKAGEVQESFENVYLTKEACVYLAKQGVQLVGIDYFSVDQKGDKSRTAHLALLNQKIVILEALLLEGVKEGLYELYCLPLKLKGLEGAPCRAVLKTID